MNPSSCERIHHQSLTWNTGDRLLGCRYYSEDLVVRVSRLKLKDALFVCDGAGCGTLLKRRTNYTTDTVLVTKLRFGVCDVRTEFFLVGNSPMNTLQPPVFLPKRHE